jgi:hypothetical protein
MKMNYANDIGITLITIPFWWDESLPTLTATIKALRPELITDSTSSDTVKLDMPLKFHNTFKYTPNLPKPYQENIDLTGW